jgi:hypothetical protein
MRPVNYGILRGGGEGKYYKQKSVKIFISFVTLSFKWAISTRTVIYFPCDVPGAWNMRNWHYPENTTMNKIADIR